MGDFLTDLRSIVIGGQALALIDREVRYEPIMVAGRRIGTRLRIVGEGEIDGSTVLDLAAQATAATNSFVVSGRDVQLVWYGQTEINIAAAAVAEGGPHITFTMLRQGSGAIGLAPFSFELEAKTVSDAGGSIASTYHDTTDTKPDGLRVFTRSGDILSSDARDKALEAINAFIVGFATNFVLTRRSIDVDDTDTHATYTVEMTELMQPLPKVPGALGSAVDGDTFLRRTRDEQMRLVQEFSFDLLVIGDYNAVVNQLRSIAQQMVGNLPIMAEQFEASFVSQVRIRGTFTFLSGGNGNALLNWQQSFRIVASDNTTWEERRYPGVQPFLVRKTAGVRKLIQSGSATGAGLYPVRPDPLYPDRLLEDPDATYTDVNDTEKMTNWTYTIAVGQSSGGLYEIVNPDQLARPGAPEFWQ